MLQAAYQLAYVPLFATEAAMILAHAHCRYSSWLQVSFSSVHALIDLEGSYGQPYMTTGYRTPLPSSWVLLPFLRPTGLGLALLWSDR